MQDSGNRNDSNKKICFNVKSKRYKNVVTIDIIRLVK